MDLPQMMSSSKVSNRCCQLMPVAQFHTVFLDHLDNLIGDCPDDRILHCLGNEKKSILVRSLSKESWCEKRCYRCSSESARALLYPESFKLLSWRNDGNESLQFQWRFRVNKVTMNECDCPPCTKNPDWLKDRLLWNAYIGLLINDYVIAWPYELFWCQQFSFVRLQNTNRYSQKICNWTSLHEQKGVVEFVTFFHYGRWKEMQTRVKLYSKSCKIKKMNVDHSTWWNFI